MTLEEAEILAKVIATADNGALPVASLCDKLTEAQLGFTFSRAVRTSQYSLHGRMTRKRCNLHRRDSPASLMPYSTRSLASYRADVQPIKCAGCSIDQSGLNGFFQVNRLSDARHRSVSARQGRFAGVMIEHRQWQRGDQ